MTEEVTQNVDELEQDNKRNLLAGLLAGLHLVLPFLEQSLEKHFGQAVAASQNNQPELSQAHASVVSAALGDAI